jgi:hypothetical protein
MRASYAVVWQDGELPQGTGKLKLLRRALRLDGVSGDEPVVLDVPYDELAGVRIGRLREERLAGSASLVLERRAAPPVRVASFGQPNLISEIAERLAALELGGHAVGRAAVIVPIEPGTHERARELLAGGPPFDPEAVGLERHQVFLTTDEVVFLFESRLGAPAARQRERPHPPRRRRSPARRRCPAPGRARRRESRAACRRARVRTPNPPDPGGEDERVEPACGHGHRGDRRGDAICVDVERGRGFAESEVSTDALGLVGMRERLALLGGTLTIESTPGEGTSLAAYVPAG